MDRRVSAPRRHAHRRKRLDPNVFVSRRDDPRDAVDSNPISVRGVPLSSGVQIRDAIVIAALHRVKPARRRTLRQTPPPRPTNRVAIRPVAHQLSQAKSALYLGRGALYPLAMEGALKLKELSYIHAEGFASGEMKHGPIALIEEDLPVVALLAADAVMAKASSNLREASARGGKIILLSEARAAAEVDYASAVITVSDVDPLLAPILLAIPAQILAYLTAVEKGTDVDQPRNLAKSVTVE